MRSPHPMQNQPQNMPCDFVSTCPEPPRWTAAAWDMLTGTGLLTAKVGDEAKLRDLYFNSVTPAAGAADFFPWGFLKRINAVATRQCYSLIEPSRGEANHDGFGPLMRMLDLVMDWVMQLEFGKRHYPNAYKLSVIPPNEKPADAIKRCKADGKSVV